MSTSPPRRILSSPTSITVGLADGTKWVTNPASYKGSQTFNALQAALTSIPTTGGWGQLANTTLNAAYLTTAQSDAISPSPVLRGTTFPSHMVSVWGSAAWNGYGWFIGAVGGHYAYWGNDMYMIRIADPVGAHRLYDPAPIAAVAYRAGSKYPQDTLVPQSAWSTLATSEVEDALPAWGPRATHQYSGLKWDPATEKLLMGGSNQNSCLNATQGGSPAVMNHNLWVMSANASTPKSAWTKHALGDGRGGAFGIVDNSDGTFSLRTWQGRFTFKPATDLLQPGGFTAPIHDRYTPWRPCFRDPITNKYYEIHRKDRAAVYNNPPYTHAIFEVTGGSYLLRCELPSTYRVSNADTDQHGGVAVVNGHAYIWCGDSSVYRVNLTNYTVESYSDAMTIAQPPGGNRGVWGRWAWVPQARCFVGVASEATNAYVFRPPSTWGL